jgi:hypothetical protein
MDNSPPSSQPALQDSSTKLCAICNSFEGLPGYALYRNPGWNDIVESARTCVSCDVIVRGCRGWLDEDGKQDCTPINLILRFRYPMPKDWQIQPCPGNMHINRDYEGVDELYGSHYICVHLTWTSVVLKMFVTKGKYHHSMIFI